MSPCPRFYLFKICTLKAAQASLSTLCTNHTSLNFKIARSTYANIHVTRQLMEALRGKWRNVFFFYSWSSRFLFWFENWLEKKFCHDNLKVLNFFLLTYTVSRYMSKKQFPVEEKAWKSIRTGKSGDTIMLCTKILLGTYFNPDHDLSFNQVNQAKWLCCVNDSVHTTNHVFTFCFHHKTWNSKWFPPLHTSQSPQPLNVAYLKHKTTCTAIFLVSWADISGDQKNANVAVLAAGCGKKKKGNSMLTRSP